MEKTPAGAVEGGGCRPVKNDRRTGLWCLGNEKGTKNKKRANRLFDVKNKRCF